VAQVQSVGSISGVLQGELSILVPNIMEPLVRIGNANDGGYILPKAVLSETRCLLSFGINDDWSFESHWLSLAPDTTIHAYDHTVSSKKFRRHSLRTLRQALYGKKTISDVSHSFKTWSSYRSFFANKVIHFAERVHNRVQYHGDADFSLIFSRIPEAPTFLKIDIEGSEYRLIDSLLEYADRITGFVVEFHDCERLRLLLIDSVKRLSNRFLLVHTHGNNAGPLCPDGLPEGLELTFVNSRYANLCHGKRLNLPIPELDRPNIPTIKDYALSCSK
jgi:hypothetical protein